MEIVALFARIFAASWRFKLVEMPLLLHLIRSFQSTSTTLIRTESVEHIAAGSLA